MMEQAKSRVVYSRSLGLNGRFMTAGKEERCCALLAYRDDQLEAAVADDEGAAGEGRMILYADLIGRIEGMAAWKNNRVFHIAVKAPAEKLQRLQRQFEVIARTPPEGRGEFRTHRRILPEKRQATITLATGQVIEGEIVDFSRSGAAIRCAHRPKPSEVITVGSTRGKVVRHAQGFAVEFLRLLPLESFGASYQL